MGKADYATVREVKRTQLACPACASRRIPSGTTTMAARCACAGYVGARRKSPSFRVSEVCVLRAEREGKAQLEQCWTKYTRQAGCPA